ncbi:MAG: hypothetical protein AAFP90_10900 [Planctomycetota bacterium]
MSKKGSHGDGQHGKGTKGMKKPFKPLFDVQQSSKAQQQRKK